MSVRQKAILRSLFSLISFLYLQLVFMYYSYIISIILLGFRYSASSIPSIPSAGVAIGAGSTPSISIFATCRNPIITNVLIRRALIGSPSVEVPGFIGSIYSLLIPYAFHLYYIPIKG